MHWTVNLPICSTDEAWVSSPLNKVKFGTLKHGDRGSIISLIILCSALMSFKALIGCGFCPCCSGWLGSILCSTLYGLAKGFIPPLPLMPLANGGNGLGAILLAWISPCPSIPAICAMRGFSWYGHASPGGGSKGRSRVSWLTVFPELPHEPDLERLLLVLPWVECLASLSSDSSPSWRVA
ncbi:unnamed protein product [Prunus armeniaca]